ENAGGSPYLVSIGEKAELIARNFKERQLTTEDALSTLKETVCEINDARDEQKRSEMTNEAFSIYWILKKERIASPREKALHMEGVFGKYPHWKLSESHEREVRKELYFVLMPGIKDVPKITKLAQKILRTLRENA
ncbi:MAG: hypothetical protein ACXQT0_01575, partial [Candidatus Methanofastidiosia archaeon]